MLSNIHCASDTANQYNALLPEQLALTSLSTNKRKLLRATLEVEGLLPERELAFSKDFSTLSGVFPLPEASYEGAAEVSIRLYGRYTQYTREVLLAQQVQTLNINSSKKNAVAIDTPWNTGTPDDPLFDRNRNGVTNLDDLHADVDPAPPAPLLQAGPALVELVSGFSGERNVVSIDNLSAQPLEVTVQILDAPGTYLAEFSSSGSIPTRSLSLGTLQPFAHKLLALTFLPPNSYIQSGAVLVRANNPQSGVRYATSVELVGNSNEGALLQPIPSNISLPAPPTLEFSGPTSPYPLEEIFSGEALSKEESETYSSLSFTGQNFGPVRADLVYTFTIPKGFDFYTRLWGLSVDVDLVLIPLNGTTPLFDERIAPVAPGMSAEGMEILRTDRDQSYALVLRVNEPGLARLAPETVVDVPFFLSVHAITGPRFAEETPVTPALGSTRGGEEVTLRGIGFSSGSQVSFNGIAATNEVVNPAGTEIILTTPATVFGSHLAAVRILNPSFTGQESSSTTLPDAYQYLPPAPSVMSVLPSTVLSEGGTPITIKGKNLGGDFGAPLILFGDTPAQSVVLVNGQTLLIQSPPLNDGLYDLTIRVFYRAEQTKEATSTDAITAAPPSAMPPLIQSFSPTAVLAAGGEEITLTGTNFLPGSTILIDDAAIEQSSIQYINDTEISFTSPACTPGAHTIRIIGPGGQSASASQNIECTGEPPRTEYNEPAVLNIYHIGGVMVHRKAFSLILEGLKLNPGELLRVDALAADGNAYSFVTQFATDSLVRVGMDEPGLAAGEYRIFLVYQSEGTLTLYESTPRITIANDCGNGAIDGTEDCETDTPNALCASIGFQTGNLSCGLDCRWDISDCRDCGNSKREGAEQCDGVDLGGLACNDIGYLQGTLSCLNDCSWDTSLCIKCGNGIAEAGEQCDTDDFPQSCEDLGFVGGTPACNNTCAVVTSGCHNCGNGSCSSDEDYASCATDCASGCGDGQCLGAETCTTCPSDCSCDTPFRFVLVSGDGQSAYRNAQAANALVVRAEDNSGNPLGNVRVEVTASTGASVALTSIRTTSMGNASTTATLGFAVGNHTFEFRAYDPDDVELPGSPLTFSLSATEPPDGWVVPVVNYIGNNIGSDISKGVASQAQLGQVLGLAIDASGNILISDTGNHRILKVTLEGVLTVFAGGNGAGNAGDFFQASLAQINSPRGIHVGADGSVYIADSGNNRVRRVSPTGIITTYAGGGQNGQVNDGDGGPPLDAYLVSPVDMAFDGQNRLLILERYASAPRNRVRRVSADGLSISTLINGTPTGGCTGFFAPYLTRDAANRMYFSINCNGANQMFRIETDDSITNVSTTGSSFSGAVTHVYNNGYLRNMHNLVFSPAGAIWMAETSYGAESRVIRANPDYTMNTFLLGTVGSTVAPVDWIPVADTEAPELSRIVFHPTLGVLFANRIGSSNRWGIRRIVGTADESGAVFDLAPQNGSDNQTTPVNGRPAQALVVKLTNGDGMALSNVPLEFYSPDGSAWVDTATQLTVAGLASTLVAAGFAPSKAYTIRASLTPWLGEPKTIDYILMSSALVSGQVYAAINPSSVAQSAPAALVSWHSSEAKANSPYGVAAAADGSLYFSSPSACRIWRADAGGAVQRFAGNGTCTVSLSGAIAREVPVASPRALRLSPAGELAFIEFTGSRVRKILSDGTLMTVAGNGTSDCTGDGNVATNVGLKLPKDIEYDASGNLYISDTTCDTIRRVDNTTRIISTLASTGCDAGTADKYDVGSITGGVAVDKFGRIYFTGTDQGICSGSVVAGSNVIFRIDPADTTTATVVAGGGATAPDGATATSATLGLLEDITIDSETLFIALTASVIYKLDISGTSDGILRKVVGDGTSGTFNHPEAALATRMTIPKQIDVGPTGDLYFSDYNNGAVRLMVGP